jgi:hypothetical protein
LRVFVRTYQLSLPILHKIVQTIENDVTPL